MEYKQKYLKKFENVLNLIEQEKTYSNYKKLIKKTKKKNLELDNKIQVYSNLLKKIDTQKLDIDYCLTAKIKAHYTLLHKLMILHNKNEKNAIETRKERIRQKRIILEQKIQNLAKNFEILSKKLDNDFSINDLIPEKLKMARSDYEEICSFTNNATTLYHDVIGLIELNRQGKCTDHFDNSVEQNRQLDQKTVKLIDSIKSILY